MAYLKLRFTKGGSLFSSAHIVSDPDACAIIKGEKRLGPQCASALEVEQAAASLKKEIDDIVREAQKKFTKEMKKPRIPAET
jgi:hypothetical protein